MRLLFPTPESRHFRYGVFPENPVTQMVGVGAPAGDTGSLGFTRLFPASVAQAKQAIKKGLDPNAAKGDKASPLPARLPTCPPARLPVPPAGPFAHPPVCPACPPTCAPARLPACAPSFKGASLPRAFACLPACAPSLKGPLFACSPLPVPVCPSLL